MRRLFVGGNWKSNNLLADSRKLSELYNKLAFDTTRIGIDIFIKTLQHFLQKLT